MTAAHIALIVNPASGSGRASRLLPDVTARLAEAGHVTVHQRRSAPETEELAGDLVGHCDAVAVLGGDGLLQTVLQALAGTPTPLAIIPAGSGNDAAATLGLPADAAGAATAVVAAIRSGSRRTVALGRTDAGRWWFTVLCAGFDSAANERANRMRRPRGRRRYDLAIAAEVIGLRHRAMTLILDGVRLDTDVTLVAVGNGPRYGGGKLICPDADVAADSFAITVVGPVSRRTLIRLAPTMPRAGHIGHPAVTVHHAREVELRADATVGYADGEPMGPLPITTRCFPDALTVLVPPPP